MPATEAYTLDYIMKLGGSLEIVSSSAGTHAVVAHEGGSGVIKTKINITPGWANTGLPVGGRVVRLHPASGKESWRGSMKGYEGYPRTHTETGSDTN